VRILALGVLNNPRGAFTINHNARAFLHPPGIEIAEHNDGESSGSASTVGKSKSGYPYERLTHPVPAPSHAAYPFHTPGGGDKRWLTSGNIEEEGHQWVGGLMSVVQVPVWDDPS
jgi:hypothetical protein